VLPTPARVANVACQEHRTCGRTREVGDMARSMSRGQDCKERAVTEDIDHPFEFPIRVFRELKLLKCGPSIQEAIIRPLDEHVHKFRFLSLAGACVNRNFLWNVWHPRDMIEMEMGHKDTFEGSSFRLNGRQSVLLDLHLFYFREISQHPSD